MSTTKERFSTFSRSSESDRSGRGDLRVVLMLLDRKFSRVSMPALTLSSQPDCSRGFPCAFAKPTLSAGTKMEPWQQRC